MKILKLYKSDFLARTLDKLFGKKYIQAKLDKTKKFRYLYISTANL